MEWRWRGGPQSDTSTLWGQKSNFMLSVGYLYLCFCSLRPPGKTFLRLAGWNAQMDVSKWINKNTPVVVQGFVCSLLFYFFLCLLLAEFVWPLGLTSWYWPLLASLLRKFVSINHWTFSVCPDCLLPLLPLFTIVTAPFAAVTLRSLILTLMPVVSLCKVLLICSFICYGNWNLCFFWLSWAAYLKSIRWDYLSSSDYFFL